MYMIHSRHKVETSKQVFYRDLTFRNDQTDISKKKINLTQDKLQTKKLSKLSLQAISSWMRSYSLLIVSI